MTIRAAIQTAMNATIATMGMGDMPSRDELVAAKKKVDAEGAAINWSPSFQQGILGAQQVLAKVLAD